MEDQEHFQVQNIVKLGDSKEQFTAPINFEIFLKCMVHDAGGMTTFLS